MGEGGPAVCLGGWGVPACLPPPSPPPSRIRAIRPPLKPPVEGRPPAALPCPALLSPAQRSLKSRSDAGSALCPRPPVLPLLLLLVYPARLLCGVSGRRGRRLVLGLPEGSQRPRPHTGSPVRCFLLPAVKGAGPAGLPFKALALRPFLSSDCRRHQARSRPRSTERPAGACANAPPPPAEVTWTRPSGQPPLSKSVTRRRPVGKKPAKFYYYCCKTPEGGPHKPRPPSPESSLRKRGGASPSPTGR